MARTMIDPLLHDLPPFAGCTPRELRFLSPFVYTVEVMPERALMRQGDAGNELMVVASGTATVSRDGQVIAEVERGDVIGELSMLVDAPRTATVVATTAMTVVMFTPGSFPLVLDECPTIARAVLRTAIRRLAAAA